MLRMALTKEEVEHIAALARLRLSAAEQAQFREQLSAILDYMAVLRRLDTAAIAPTASSAAMALRRWPTPGRSPAK